MMELLEWNELPHSLSVLFPPVLGMDTVFTAIDAIKVNTIDDSSHAEGEITITLVDDADPKNYTIDTTEDTSTNPSTFKHKSHPLR